ncbi:MULTISPECIES: hypothetical protein [Oligella]|uniref:Uncharacterized protein n=1 Tax=Oligella urethralis DNF00040 TaxID=1401065 RepID=A0A096AI94_9BURK|nr:MULTISPECIES: hypothetical protein [Oligella]KGF30427.1 hypothetical protein HMPREF2130_07015 [Oligella urethralis DNF00040]OFV48768.1 hypothetical protein HMPREF3179_05750 [Oligella sp. HMSC09E12]
MIASRKESIDKRLVLIHHTGDRLYPFKKCFRQTGSFGYVVTPKGRRERNGDGLYLQSLEEVIPYFFYKGYSLAATTDTRPTSAGERIGAFTITGTAIVAYEIAEELSHLVATAPFQPRYVF